MPTTQHRKSLCGKKVPPELSRPGTSQGWNFSWGSATPRRIPPLPPYSTPQVATNLLSLLSLDPGGEPEVELGGAH